MNGIDGINR